MAKINIDKTWIMFGVALLLGLFAMGLAKWYLSHREQVLEEAVEARHKTDMVNLIVPVQNLAKGAEIDMNLLAVRPIPAEFVSSDAITPEEIEQFVGQTLAWEVLQGTPILRSQIDPTSQSFARILAEGKRALTIQVDDINSTSGMMVPGNHIDLLLVSDDEQGGSVRPLFQNLLVLATGQMVQGGEAPVVALGEEKKSYSTLTLELTPDQAARLVLAQKLGTIRAVLRGSNDNATVHQEAMASEDLFSSGKKDRRAQLTVELIIGGNSSKGVNESVMATMSDYKAAMPGTMPTHLPPGVAAALPALNTAGGVQAAKPGY